MKTIPGYRIVEIVSESGHSTVIRAVGERSGLPVILKTLTTQTRQPIDITSISCEFDIIQTLNLDGVPKAIALEPCQHGRMIIFEDAGMVSLDKLAAEKPFSLTDILTIGIGIADTLDEIHQLGIMHKDINPSNIVMNPDTGEIQIIDFSIASTLLNEYAEIRCPEALEGTLAYMSPEQTGRMGRSIDYRTDFYSLGVTLYELVFRELPFDHNDSLELVHAHLGCLPILPDEYNGSIPKPVFRIIEKLMAKSAEDRYLSANGISRDLNRCFKELSGTGRISDFNPGIQDVSHRFHIPQTVYGRNKEINVLLKAFGQIRSGHRELVMVCGASGVGKSVTVKEIYTPVVRQNGFFILGKCDRLKQTIPCDALIQACRQLIRQLRTDANHLDSWKQKILKALGPNGRVVTQIIPELSQIIGDQPDIPDLPPLEANNRFILTFLNFIRVFAGPEHPLVIFLDDLQWADESTITVIKGLMGNDATRHLMMVCAYRDNEIGLTHPLLSTLEDIESRLPVKQIHLGNLSPQDVNDFIKNVLRYDNGDEPHTLTGFCMDKTGGNPLFLSQCLYLLYKHDCIVFNVFSGRWEFDPSRIQPVFNADNVGDILAERVHTLPVRTLTILRLAACIGNTFNFKALHKTSSAPMKDIVACLWDALQRGLIVPSGQTPGILRNKGGVADIAWIDPALSFCFVHDRIRQAAYATMNETEKKDAHLTIGTLLLNKSSSVEREEELFHIVNHLNKGISRSKDPALRRTLAGLNLLAVKKAAKSAAFRSGLNYAQSGIQLLSKDSWTRDYHLTLDVYTRAAEAACFCNEDDLLKTYHRKVVTHARSFTDTAKIHEVAIHASISKGNLMEAVKTGLNVLQKLGVPFPEKPGFLHILTAMIQTKFSLSGKRPQDLIFLPAMTNPEILSAMRILSTINAAALAASPDLFPLLVMKQVRLSVKYGNAMESIHAYVCFGAELCGHLDIERGYEFGRLADNLMKRFQAKDMAARMFLFNNYMIRHWKEPLQSLPESYLEGYQSGLNTGDLEYAAFCRLGYFQTAFQLSGKNIRVLSREMDKAAVVLDQIHYKQSIMVMNIARQVCRNLLGQVDAPHRLKGEVYDEDAMLFLHHQGKDHMLVFIHYYWKLYLAYLFRDHEGAYDSAKKADAYIREMIATQLAPGFYFFDSLARLAVFDQSTPKVKRVIAQKVAKNLRRLKTWKRHSRVNFLSKYHLVLAERARVQGRDEKAAVFYNSAITHAKHHGLLQEVGLANELAAVFWLRLKQPAKAKLHIVEAHHAYTRLGILAKVSQLENMYPHMLCSEKPAYINPATA